MLLTILSYLLTIVNKIRPNYLCTIFFHQVHAFASVLSSNPFINQPGLMPPMSVFECPKRTKLKIDNPRKPQTKRDLIFSR